jgi:hypothetical protein
MEDVNVANDLRQLSHGQVKPLEYSRYDINGYYFRTAKLEACHPLVATTNSGVVASGEDATSHIPTIMTFFKILLSTRSVALKS